MDTFEDLLAAVEAYSDAKAEYNKAKEGCREAYFLHPERERLDHAKKQLREALEAHVQKIVAMKEVG